MEEAALNYDTLHFNLSYKCVFYNWGFTSDHQLSLFPSYDFYGEVYLLAHLQDAFMQCSPFSICFREHGPIWMHDLVPGIVPPIPDDANDIYDNDDEVYSPLIYDNYNSD